MFVAISVRKFNLHVLQNTWLRILIISYYLCYMCYLLFTIFNKVFIYFGNSKLFQQHVPMLEA